jgi:23S rRNA (cytosine1962-C5)-methyltransferase
LIHGESDGLPGLIVDQFADALVLQVSSATILPFQSIIQDELVQLTRCQSIFENSNLAIRQLEGLFPKTQWIYGEPVSSQVILENDLKYRIEFTDGQKTGFYIDQRENRYYLRSIAQDKDILDCFSYSGGFALNAIKGGAKPVTAVDTSKPALAQLRENIAMNGFDPAQIACIEEDVFTYLRTLLDSRKTFDLIVLDPPKFAPTRSSAEKAARGYKDINLNAMKLLRAGGELFTFSCSGGIDLDLFTKIVAGAASDAGRGFTITKRLFQPEDHPISLSFPDGEYLKGLHLKLA